MSQLNELISVNSNFKNAINLYLDLNKVDKVNCYIPTKSSVDMLDKYLTWVEDNKNQSTLLIGPYGKGKSHFLLVLLAILTMERNDVNDKLVEELIDKISGTSLEAAERIKNIWTSKKRFLPVIVMSTQGNLNQAFMVGLFEALKRSGLTDIVPETYFSYAIDTIKRWKSDYPETYEGLVKALVDYNTTPTKLIKALQRFEDDKYELFKEIYPSLTSGEVFNPLVNSEVITTYESIAKKLCSDYGFGGIYIIFDEFSKYIEGQDKKTSGNNMKILQDVCELATSSKDNPIFVTMVAHKSIKEYGKYLSVDIINSFTGIDGRIDEVMFVTSEKNNYELIKNAIIKNEDKLYNDKYVKKYLSSDEINKYYEIPAFSSTFIASDFEDIVAKGCFPLVPAGAYLLLKVSAKVAQNERTLFTFISKDEQYSMANHIKKVANPENWVIYADLIYDYFKKLFKKEVSNELIHNEWLNAEYAISNASSSDEIRVLKTLAIINIVNLPDEFMANEKYLKLASGVDDIENVINDLVTSGLIYKKAADQCYTFKTRATSALKKEIDKRKVLKGDRVNVNKILADISEVKYVLPRDYNYQYSVTRYFKYEFMNVEDFLCIDDLNVLFEDGVFCDGKVVALYTLEDNDYTIQIQNKLSKNNIEKLVVLYSKNVLDIVEQITEYEILQELKKDVVFFNDEGNKVLQNEIPVIEEDLEILIDNFIQNSYAEGRYKTVYCIKDGAVVCEEKDRINDIVDYLCSVIYDQAVPINSELINKEEIKTGSIKKVRKNLINVWLNNEKTEDFLNGTSADSSIFRALFVGTGIYDGYSCVNVDNMLDIFNDFIVGASDNKRSMVELINKLTAAPIGMRRGPIPVYLAYVFSKRNEDIVVYFGNKEVTITADIILNMCEHPEDYYVYISSENAIKENYLSELCGIFNVVIPDRSVESRISNIVTTMQKWYRSLPQVTKNIKKNASVFGDERIIQAYPKVKRLMQSIEPNPYEILFVDLPEAFSVGEDYSLLAKLLRDMKRVLSNYYNDLKSNAITETIKIFGEVSGLDLKHSLQEWHDKQSDLAKNGLHSSQITNFMTCIAKDKSYNDMDVIEKVAKTVTEIYMDSWNDASLDMYISSIAELKEKIEAITDVNIVGQKSKLTFVGKNGNEVTKYYEHVDEGTGSILRNIISDALEDFSDLSVNEKISILLEMIENQLG